jgi:hypothetical protein
MSTIATDGIENDARGWVERPGPPLTDAVDSTRIDAADHRKVVGETAASILEVEGN